MKKTIALTAALTAGTFACGTALAVPITDPGFDVNPNPSTIAGVSNDEVDAWQNNGPNILNAPSATNANAFNLVPFRPGRGRDPGRPLRLAGERRRLQHAAPERQQHPRLHTGRQ